MRVEGDHFCSRCGVWIGNHNTGETPEGQKSFFSIIRRKYCEECRPAAISEQTRVRLHNLRHRNKPKLKQAADELTKAVEVIEAQREVIMMLKAELENRVKR